jgi:hypothetical protein
VQGAFPRKTRSRRNIITGITARRGQPHLITVAAAIRKATALRDHGAMTHGTIAVMTIAGQTREAQLLHILRREAAVPALARAQTRAQAAVAKEAETNL